MKTLAPTHRKAVNQAAHAVAVRFWIQELTKALAAGATFAEIQGKLPHFSNEIAQVPTDR